MRVIQWADLDDAARIRLCRRRPALDAALLEQCREIFEEIRRRGDRALIDYTRRWDGVELESVTIDPSRLEDAAGRLPDATRAALETAARNIETFHRSQLGEEPAVTVQEGVRCWRRGRPLGAVGLYVPGGTAVLPSSVLMLGIPARLAGCRDVALCVPPRPDGSITDAVLEAARLAGVTRLHRVGGAQAVAALALGTESVAAVDKILGPGNRFVQAAKLFATFCGVAIDMVAGPSEVLVIADGDADSELVAADLVAQAEHGEDSIGVLATDSAALAEAVVAQVEEQLAGLERAALASRAMQQSFVVVTGDLDEAVDFSNEFAPEHLLLHVSDARGLAERVEAAGSVFLGQWSPEVAGDYASGTNHTLPTGGWARSTSGVSIDTMLKKVTFQELSPKGLQELAPTLRELARVEKLDGHRLAVERRLRRLAEVGS